MRKIDYMLYCPVCGDFVAMPNPERTCDICNVPFVEIKELTVDDYYDKLETWEKRYKIQEELFERIIKPNPLFSQKAHDKRIYDEEHYSAPISFKPKCPICGSYDVHKIGLGNKIGSVAAIGIFSLSHVGKTYKCSNCGSKF